jgi:PTH1 family peptidyl-tRNA hydrolase
MSRPEAPPVELIVGLGNPGRQYADTRHNVGVWYLEALARALGVTLTEDKKAFGWTGHTTWRGRKIRLLIPTTYMNRSGQATSAVANFFKIPPEAMLVAHDDLDLPPGTARLKQGGGHGGHNGLRDIISRHGNRKDFLRLRLGVGHPGNSDQVTPWVLNKPSPDDRRAMDDAIDESVRQRDYLFDGDLQRAMTELNGFRA